jgi:hypothetical protein
MPGTTRFFESNAARQRAYRRRKQEGTAAELNAARDTTFWAHVVQAAVAAARQSGDGVAAQVHHADAFDTLRAVAEHFYDRAGTPAAREAVGKSGSRYPERRPSGFAGLTARREASSIKNPRTEATKPRRNFNCRWASDLVVVRHFCVNLC